MKIGKGWAPENNHLPKPIYFFAVQELKILLDNLFSQKKKGIRTKMK